MLKSTASREHRFIRNIRLELCKTVLPSSEQRCLHAVKPFRMHRDLSMAYPSDPHSTSSAFERSTSARVHQVSILPPQNSGSSSIPPPTPLRSKASLFDGMSLDSLLVISWTRLLSPSDPTEFDFLLHGVDRCSTQLLLA